MSLLFNKPIPPLRGDLEMSPFVHEDHQMILLSDILGLEEKPIAVPMAVFAMASLFDGKRTTKEIQGLLTQQKIILSETEVEQAVNELNKYGLLETPEAQEKRQARLKTFQESDVRKTNMPSRGLPENTLDLAVHMGKFYDAEKGPGNPLSDAPKEPCPLGLISPHIDLHRGGPIYAWAYGELAKHEKPDVIIALGVAHMSPRSPWVMTKKAYQTPFGPMNVNKELYEEIKQTLWYDPLEEEWVHAKEHALEFQALWLKYLWRDECPEWVPILVSSYERFCTDRPPSQIESIEGLISKVSKIIEDRTKKGQKILILSGIDLAHVGKKFGDKEDMTPELEKKIKDADQSSMDNALKLKADDFFMSGIGEGAWRKVCGLSALYTGLRWIKTLGGDKVQGKQLAYDQQPDPAGGVVSFVSAIFPRN